MGQPGDERAKERVRQLKEKIKATPIPPRRIPKLADPTTPYTPRMKKKKAKVKILPPKPRRKRRQRGDEEDTYNA